VNFGLDCEELAGELSSI